MPRRCSSIAQRWPLRKRPTTRSAPTSNSSAPTPPTSRRSWPWHGCGPAAPSRRSRLIARRAIASTKPRSVTPNPRHESEEFIEKTHDLFPGMIYTNVSFVGSTALADELMLLGPRYASGVIVTQVVPAVSGYSSVVLEYKNALAKYFAGESPDYVSLEGYVAANVLIKGLQRAGPQLDTEKLIDALENSRNFDLGLGANLGFGRAEHQASHKIWGTAIDDNGKYQAIELE